MIKKITLFIFLILIVAALVCLYKYDTFQIKEHANQTFNNLPFISDYFKLNIKYRVKKLLSNDQKEITTKYKPPPSENSIRDIQTSHNDRYMDTIISLKDNSDSIEKEDFNYPTSEKQEYSSQELEMLAKVYSSMEPDQAVLIMNELEDHIIINIFSHMKITNIAEIMSAFEPKRASTLSLKILDKPQNKSPE